MSAYIVEKETIDRIVTYIHNQPIAVIENSFPAIYQAYQNGNKWPDNQALGQRLWVMNTKAVDTRYDENNPFELYRFDFRVSRPVQIYKSCRCYLYQCAEGDVPESPLYQDLEKLCTRLATEIISGLPEYDQADWG